MVREPVTPITRLSLADYRRRVAELYADVRAMGSASSGAARHFRETRDRLFAEHPQSPLDVERRRGFTGLRYYPYDPALRVLAGVDASSSAAPVAIELGADGTISLERVGTVTFDIEAQRVTLSLFWIAGYGGGLFLPFGDATNGAETYGGGRYLLDTVKGADLGSVHDELLLDFNYAYNPSCAYSPRWTCPLAPLENRLPIPIRGGEREASVDDRDHADGSRPPS